MINIVIGCLHMRNAFTVIVGYWGLEKGISEVFTYDEKDFRRIEGLKVHKP